LLTAVRSGIARLSRLHRWTQGGIAFVLYLGVSIVLFGLPVLSNPSGTWAGVGTNDAKLYTWDLVWWPHAISHHLNPFVTHVVFAPTGANLAWVTGLPGPSLLMTPITHEFGPVVASNLLTLLSCPAAAWAAYLVCRRLTPRFWPALAGGLLFGFSTYMTTATRGHLNLSLTAAVPIAVYLVIRRAEGTLLVWFFVPLLAVDLVAQFLTSTEVFASMAVFGVLTVLLALVVLPDRRRTVLVGPQIAAAYVLAAAALTPYLIYVFRDVPPAPLKDATPASADLLGFVLPRSTILVGHGAAASATAGFTARLSEDGSYVGIPLLLVVVAFAVFRWRDPLTRLLVPVFVMCEVAALGPVLHVGGTTSVTMPWIVAGKTPLLQNALPVRFTMYAALTLAAIVARWLGADGRLSWARWALVIFGAIALVPRVTSEWHPPVDVPRFFTDGTYRSYVSPGETLVVLPVTESMLWQAEADMAFSMPTGRFGSEPSGYPDWDMAKHLRWGSITSRRIPELRQYLADHHVAAIVVGEAAAREWSEKLAPLGIVPTAVGGVEVYPLDALGGSA
jgi:hypothetical protein